MATVFSTCAGRHESALAGSPPLVLFVGAALVDMRQIRTAARPAAD
jgi:hypothetical protein